jgi:protein-tyrosine-phosphatase
MGRSPAAAAILRRLLDERGYGAEVTVESGGLCTYELERVGLEAEPRTASVAEKLGLDLRAHRAQPATLTRVLMADLIVVMEGWQKALLQISCRRSPKPIYTLRELAGAQTETDTADPITSPLSEVEKYFAEADACFRRALTSGPLADLLAPKAEPGS